MIKKTLKLLGCILVVSLSFLITIMINQYLIRYHYNKIFVKEIECKQSFDALNNYLIEHQNVRTYKAFDDIFLAERKSCETKGA